MLLSLLGDTLTKVYIANSLQFTTYSNVTCKMDTVTVTDTSFVIVVVAVLELDHRKCPAPSAILLLGRQW